MKAKGRRICGTDDESSRREPQASYLGFCGVGKHSHKKAINLVTCMKGSNSACAYVWEGADLISKTALGIGISRDLSVLTSSEAGSLR